MESLFETWHGKEGGRITCMPAATHTEANSPAMLRAIRALAEKYNVGYTIHLGQSLIEVESMVRTRGVRPAHYLFSHDFLGPRLIAGHCRYLDPAEIAVMGTTRTGVSHQPAMAARRAVIPPIPALQAAGCPIAMGTDNNTQDMVEVLRVGLMIDRILRDDPVYPQPEDVLEWMTRGGAQVLAMEDQIGSLEVGKKADLFVVNTLRAHLVPTMRIVSSFIHNGQPSDIEAVMVDGHFLMRDHKVLTVDEADIIARADEIGRRAWQTIRTRYPGVAFPFSLAPA
jgi:cytosine/adenosine deaminase-related metal-dependent hydrolase